MKISQISIVLSSSDFIYEINRYIHESPRKLCELHLKHPRPKVKKQPTMAFQIISCTLTQQLLQTIQRDYSLKDDLVDKYLGTQTAAAVPLPPKETRVKEKKKRQIREKPADQLCTGKTAKGEPCKFAVKCDGLCGIHLRQLNRDTTKETTKVPKKSKKSAEAPKHTHPLTEEADDTCKLCETQGNVMGPELTKAEFEAVAENGLSIQERLKAILANSEEDPEDPEEEPSTSEVEETLKVRLAKLIAEEDDEDEDDVEIEQLVETPPSQAKLSELMGKLSTQDGKAYNFDALCEEMEEE